MPFAICPKCAKGPLVRGAGRVYCSQGCGYDIAERLDAAISAGDKARAEAEALRVALRSVGSQAGMGPGNLDDARRLLESIEETARKALAAGAAPVCICDPPSSHNNPYCNKCHPLGGKPAAEPPAKCHCGGNHTSTECPTCNRFPDFDSESEHAPPKPEPRAEPNKWCAPSCNHFAERLGAENKATHHELFQPSNGAPILIARCDAHCECDRPASQGGK